MSTPRAILFVGLTGGIAAGKTTVAGFFAESGAFVIDADAIVHDLIAPGGAAHARVMTLFGAAVVAPGGEIDRQALGSLVFADPEARKALEAAVHPGVRREVRARLEDCRATGLGPIAILDAALLVETGFHREVDRLVVVKCSRRTQLRRLLRRRMRRTDAVARIESQAPLEDKLALADYVIETDASLEETRRRTQEVHASLLRDLEARENGTR